MLFGLPTGQIVTDESAEQPADVKWPISPTGSYQRITESDVASRITRLTVPKTCQWKAWYWIPRIEAFHVSIERVVIEVLETVCGTPDKIRRVPQITGWFMGHLPMRIHYILGCDRLSNPNDPHNERRPPPLRTACCCRSRMESLHDHGPVFPNHSVAIAVGPANRGNWPRPSERGIRSLDREGRGIITTGTESVNVNRCWR
jgi:hypothetical protein